MADLGQRNIGISIHALLAESDLGSVAVGLPISNFYPRSPCGERPPGRAPLSRVIGISIHALLAESDAQLASYFCQRLNFYPRSPCGERRA